MRQRFRVAPSATGSLRAVKEWGVTRLALSELPSSPLPYFVFVIDSAWLTLLALNRTIWARELDLPVLFLGSVTALAGTALVLGGREKGRRFSLFRGLRQVLWVLVFQVPVLAAMASAVLLSGSLRSDDILAAQGGWPWQWFAFSNPAALGIFVAVLLGLVPVLKPASGALAVAIDERAGPRRRKLVTTLPEWSHLILASGVISLLFLGGPRLPGLVAWGVGSSVALQVCGALLFQAKAVAVLSVVLALRFATNHVALREVARLGVRYLLPATIALVVAGYSWAFGVESPILAAARVPLSYGLFFLSALCAVHLCFRVAGRLAGDAPRTAINPWL